MTVISTSAVTVPFSSDETRIQRLAIIKHLGTNVANELSLRSFALSVDSGGTHYSHYNCN